MHNKYKNGRRFDYLLTTTTPLFSFPVFFAVGICTSLDTSDSFGSSFALPLFLSVCVFAIRPQNALLVLIHLVVSRGTVEFNMIIPPVASSCKLHPDLGRIVTEREGYLGQVAEGEQGLEKGGPDLRADDR